MKLFIDSGLEDRLMSGSDDVDIKMTPGAVKQLSFLTEAQKEEIFYKNAEAFFRQKENKSMNHFYKVQIKRVKIN